MKRTLLILMMWQICCLHALCQSEESRVVDASTGEPLPYAGVYVRPEVGTMTNDDGFFRLDVEAGQPIRITYIGYETLRTTWTGGGQTFRLKPLATDMQEITVTVADQTLWKVAQRLYKEYKGKRKKKANYFYRLTNTYAGVTEMTEAFLSAQSAVNVRNMEFYNGRSIRQTRHSRTASNIGYTNLQQLVCLGPATEDNSFWRQTLRPIYLLESVTRPKSDESFVLFQKKRDRGRSTIKEEKKRAKLSPYYETTATRTTTAEGQEIVCLNIKQKHDGVTNITLEGRLYVDAKTYWMLSFEGTLKNMTMDAGVDFHNKSSLAETNIRVMYTHERGFTEVESAMCELNAGNLTSRSIIYNMYNQPLPFKETTRLEQNLTKVINEAGYDSTLWNMDVVRRTVEEQQLAWFANLNDEEQQEWLLTHTDTAFIHTGVFRPLVSRLDKFAQTIPQEKVYLHMDNTSYMLGDTLWFKAYTRQTGTDKPSNVSGVLYAELWNHDGYMLQRKQIEMKNGSGHGFFVLGKELTYAGFHEIRAYTRWQLNWGLHEHKHSRVAGKWFPNEEFEQRFYRDYDKLYSRTFPVYDAPLVPGEFDHTMTLRAPRRSFKKEQDKRELVLSLFPEGGTLVKGVPCRVAYEAAWDDGQWVEGHLYVDNDSFPAVDRGRGSFVYTPTDKKPKIFFRTAEGEEVTAKLPDIANEGVSLQVVRNGDEWRILTNTTGNVNPEELAMTITLQGHVEHVHTNVGSPLVIPVHELRPGVHQVTVFNTEGRVFADRLFFSYRPADVAPTLRLSGVRDTYQPFESIKLTLEGKAEASDISIAVRDADRLDTPFDNGNILTEMLLASEIKGFVPNPGFYFEAYDDAHLQALDLLLMTQGWRRFEWRHMAVRGAWEIIQPDEKSPILIGKVYPYDDFYFNVLTGEANFGFIHTDEFRDKSETRSEDAFNEFANERINAPTAEEAAMAEKSRAEEAGKRADRSGKTAKTKDKDTAFKRDTKDIHNEVTVHTELLPLVSTGEKNTAYVDGVHINEKMTQNGMFRIQLPRRYEPSILYLDASDTTKWTKKKKYEWVFVIRSGEDHDRVVSLQDKIKYYNAPPEFYVMVDFPYPRFCKPYTFHQTHLLESGGGFDPTARTMLSDGTTQMEQVTVKSKRNIMRRFSDEFPVLMIDGQEAYNMALDAGISFIRTLVGDYGLEYPYFRTGEGRLEDNIRTNFRLTDWRRRNLGLSNHPDSIYLRSQLKSFRRSGLGTDSPRKDDTFKPDQLHKIVFYSDYAPRLEGSRRYYGSNLPETDAVIYDHPNQDRHPMYRNRRYVLPGFAACGEFYNPDYSKRKPKADEADYRRTLYWNPNVRLDKNGHAEVKFFNNSRTTNIAVEMNGQTENGTLLWGKE